MKNAQTTYNFQSNMWGANMSEFIKSSNLKNIKIKLIIIYLLNVTDIYFTLFLLKTGMFIEANLIMRSVVKCGFYSVLVKILLPFILLSYIYVRIREAAPIQLKHSNVIINFILFLYFFVCSFHLLFTLAYFIILQ